MNVVSKDAISEQYINRTTFNELDIPPHIVSRGSIEQIFWDQSSDCLLIETNTALWVYDSGNITQSPQFLASSEQRIHFLSHPNGNIIASSNIHTLSEDGELMVRTVGSSVCCATYVELVETETSTIIARSQAVNRTSFLSFALSEDEQMIYGVSTRGMIFAWARNDENLDREFIIGQPRPLRNVYDYGFDATDFYPFILIDRNIYLGQLDGSIQVWDVVTQSLVSTWRGHVGALTQLVISPDARLIASGSDDGSIRVWDIATGTTINIIQSMDNHAAPVRGLVFSLDGEELIAGDAFGTIRTWSVNNDYSRILYSTDNTLEDVVYSPDGRYLVAAQNSGVITVLNSETYSTANQLIGHSGSVNSIDFSEDGTVLASGGDDTTVRLWDVETGESVSVFEEPLWSVRQVIHQPVSLNASGVSRQTSDEDIGRFFSISWDDIYRQHDPNINYTRSGSANAETYIESIAISPNGRLMTIGAWDGSVRLWLESNGYFGRTFITLSNASSRINALAFSPDNRTLAAATEDGGIYLWDVSIPTTQFIGRLQADLNGMNDLVFTLDGRYLVGVGADVWLWDAQTYQELTILRGHQEQINAVTLNFDGSIVTAGDDGTVRSWNIVDAIPVNMSYHFGLLGQQYGHDDNGTLVAVTSIGSNIYSWEVETGSTVGIIRSVGNLQPNARLEAFAVAPDASFVISVYDFQRSIEMLDMQTGFVIPRWFTDSLSAHEFSIQISSDGQWIASEGYNNITIWDATTGDPIAIKETSSESSIRFFFVDGTNYLYVLDGTLNQFAVWDYINNVDVASPGREPLVTFDGVLFFNDGTQLDLRTGTEATTNFEIQRSISFSIDGPNVVISPNGSYLAAGGSEWWAVWNTQSGELLVEMTGSMWGIPNLVTFSSDSQHLYIRHQGMLLSWDMEDFR